MVIPYRPAPPGPYPEDIPRANDVAFTPTQVSISAIKQKEKQSFLLVICSICDAGCEMFIYLVAIARVVSLPQVAAITSGINPGLTMVVVRGQLMYMFIMSLHASCRSRSAI